MKSQLSEKGVSTTPSEQKLSSTNLHTYHQYDSLVHFITSFMNDFRFHINELKSIVYASVGVDLTLFAPKVLPSDCDQCEYCEIEFLMKSCRNAREDIVRILSIMRGYQTSKVQNAFNEENCELQKRKQTQISLNFNFLQKIEKNLEMQAEKQIKCDMGILTFRQIIKNRDHSNPLSKNGQIPFCKQSPLGNSLQIKSNFTHRSSINEHNFNQKQDIRIQFNKAYQLIRMIRKEVKKNTYYSCNLSSNLSSSRSHNILSN